MTDDDAAVRIMFYGPSLIICISFINQCTTGALIIT